MEKEEEFNMVLVLILVGLLGIGVFIAYARGVHPLAYIHMQPKTAMTENENMQQSTPAGQAASAASIFAFTAPNTVTEGATVPFSWDATKTTEQFTNCAGSTEPPGSDGGWSGDKPLKGSQSVGPILKNTVYFLDCSNSATEDTKRDVEIVSVFPVRVSIDAYPAKVSKGSSAMIEWNSTHADSCMITDDAGAVVGKSLHGSHTVKAVVANTTYTITCETPTGPKSDSAIVTVSK